MKCNEEKLTKEIKKKDKELSRMQGGQVQEQPKTKQPDSQSTDTNVSIVHICIYTYVRACNYCMVYVHTFFILVCCCLILFIFLSSYNVLVQK